MRKGKRVTYAAFQSAISAPPAFAGEITLCDARHAGIEMFLEGGMLIIYYKGHEVGVPTMNVKSLLFAKELETQNRLSA